MDASSKNILACLVATEHFDDILTNLAVLAYGKSELPDLPKHERKQWRKVSDRLIKLRDWSFHFGPGSDCR